MIGEVIGEAVMRKLGDDAERGAPRLSEPAPAGWVLRGRVLDDASLREEAVAAVAASLLLLAWTGDGWVVARLGVTGDAEGNAAQAARAVRAGCAPPIVAAIGVAGIDVHVGGIAATAEGWSPCEPLSCCGAEGDEGAARAAEAAGWL